jgi:hypothetical protein
MLSAPLLHQFPDGLRRASDVGSSDIWLGLVDAEQTEFVAFKDQALQVTPLDWIECDDGNVGMAGWRGLVVRGNGSFPGASSGMLISPLIYPSRTSPIYRSRSDGHMAGTAPPFASRHSARVCDHRRYTGAPDAAGEECRTGRFDVAKHFASRSARVALS